MKKIKYAILSIFMLASGMLYAQVTITGKVTDENTREPMPGVTIVNSEKAGANTYLLNDAKSRVFGINREKIAPIIVIDTPIVVQQNKLAVLGKTERLLIKGSIEDASRIISFTINNQEVTISEDKKFTHTVTISTIKLIEFVVQDCYNNETRIEYELLAMEVDAPLVRITTPYAGDNNEIYLD